MTYRERRERRAERLREWADKREGKAAADAATEHRILDVIPPGQPVLVGHHSEKGHRRDLERADAARRRARESADKADDFRTRADSIDEAAEHAIYSDDPDAVERLRERVADLEGKRDTAKARNAEYRKAHRDELKAMSAYERAEAVPAPPWMIANLSGNISRNRKRLAQLEAEAAAVASGDRGHGKVMDARYAGECAECGGAVERGETMTYYRRTREVVCRRCEGGEA